MAYVNELDWDDKNVESPKISITNKWEGEDEDNVLDNWDDEESKVSNQLNVNASSKSKLNIKKQQNHNKALNEVKSSVTKKNDNCKIPTKLELLRIQQEDDLKNALDTFGITKTSDENSLDAFISSNMLNFDEFTSTFCKSISKFKNQDGYANFIEGLIRNLCVDFDSSTIKKIKITMDNLYMEKQKVEKEKVKKSSIIKGKTKINLRVDSDTDLLSKSSGYDYYYNDDDFM